MLLKLAKPLNVELLRKSRVSEDFFDSAQLKVPFKATFIMVKHL